MTEPREPEFPQPEGTPVMPPTPPGHWPPPPAAAPSYPPPPPPAAGFPVAPPPMPPAPGSVPVAPLLPPAQTYLDPPATPVHEVAVDEEASAQIAEAEADEISEGAPLYEAEPVAEEPVAVTAEGEGELPATTEQGDVEPVAVEPISVVPSDVPVAEPVVEAELSADTAQVGDQPAENASPELGEVVAANEEAAVEPATAEAVDADVEVVEAEVVDGEGVETASEAPVLPGPILPAVPAWQAPPAPEPVADQAPAQDAEAPVSDEAPVAAPEGAAAAPGLLLPPAPPSHIFPPAPVPTPAPEEALSAPEAAATFAAPGDEATEVVPTWGGTPVVEPTVAVNNDIFRPYPGGTAASDAQAVTEEERRLAAERAARRDARAAALTATAVVPPTPDPAPVPVLETAAPAREIKRTTDGFWGSLGLFLVRVAMAAIFGVHGVQMLVQSAATQKLFAGTILPMPATLGLVTAIASVLIAISMLLGLATRYSGAGAALIGVGSLALVYWGSWGVFAPGQFGFLGESVLLVAAVGLLLTFIGGGGWSLDHSLRAGRHRDRATRAIG